MSSNIDLMFENRQKKKTTPTVLNKPNHKSE